MTARPPRATWARAWVGTRHGAVEGQTMRVDGDTSGVVFPCGCGCGWWVAQEEPGGTVVAVRPTVGEAKEAAVAWVQGLREISRLLRQVRMGRPT